MHRRITEQNADMNDALNMSLAQAVWNNLDLCNALGIQPPPNTYRQDYVASDVDVKIFRGQQ
jgi:hypothetical protein